LRPLISVFSDFSLQKLIDRIVVNLTCLGTLTMRVDKFAEKSVYFEVVPLFLDRELRWVVAIEAIDFCVF